MANKPTARSLELKSWQLEKMPVSTSWNLSVEEVERLGEREIRVHVSMMNRVHETNIKVHKNNDKTLTLWYSPSKRNLKPINPLFEQLITTQQEYNILKEEIKRKMNAIPKINASADLELYGQMEDKINEITKQLKAKQERWARKNRGGKLSQPLEVILNRLGITKEIWDLQTGYEKTRRWIAEEVKIKLEKAVAK